MNWQTEQRIQDTYRNTQNLISQISTVKTQTEWLLNEVVKSARTLSRLCDQVKDLQPDNSDSF